MIRPVPSTSVVISGAETTAGSIAEPAQQQRQHRGDGRRPDADREDRRCDDAADVRRRRPSSARPAEGRRRAMTSADDQPDAQLLEHDPADVAQRDLAEGHRADDERHRLAADVAAGPDQERDEEAQGDDRRELVLEVAQHRARVGLGDEQQQQPADALADEQRRRSTSGTAGSAAAEPPRRSMSSVASASRTSATSSSVMIPSRWSSSSTTGIASRLRSVRIRAAVSWSAVARTRTVEGAMSSLDRRVARAEQQAVQRQDAEQVALVVDHVDVVDRLGLVDEAPDRARSPRGRRVGRETATKAGVMIPPAVSGG